MKTYKAIGLTALICIILTSSLLYVFGATPTSTFYVSSGVYPHGVSYTVWIEGSNYFAKNENGFVDFSGTNGSGVIQSCLDALTRGGIVFLNGRTFNLGTYGIQLKYDGTYLRGLSNSITPHTELSYSGTGTAITVNKTDGSSFYDYEISNFYLDANGATGILLYNAHWGIVHDCYIYDTDVGIKAYGAWESFIKNNQIRTSTAKGIWIDGGSGKGSHHISIEKNYFDGHSYCIYIDDDANNPFGIKIKDNNFGLSTDQVGIVVSYQTRNLRIEGNHFEEGSGQTNVKDLMLNGVGSKPMVGTQIIGNTFIINDEAIYLDYCTGVYIYRNIAWGYSGSACFLNMTPGHADNVRAEENNLIGTAPSYQGLTDEAYVILDSNSGTETTVSNGDWQLHYLDGTPDVIILTPHSNVVVYVNARNSTHFQFGVASGTPDIDWYAEYKP